MTWRGRSVQCCIYSNWVHLKCSLLSFSRFRTLGSSHSWSCPPCFFFEILHLPALCLSPQTPPAGIPPLLNLAPFLLMQHSHPILAFKPSILFPPTLYRLPLHPHHRLMLLAVSLYLLLSLPLHNSLNQMFFNRMLWVFKRGAIHYYTLFRLIPLILYISRNLALIYLPLYRSLDSMLCDPMAPTPDLVFFLLMSQTLAAASSFSSSRAYPSLSFLPSLFLRLTPTLIV